jgi:hypothetical protein
MAAVFALGGLARFTDERCPLFDVEVWNKTLEEILYDRVGDVSQTAMPVV